MDTVLLGVCSCLFVWARVEGRFWWMVDITGLNNWAAEAGLVAIRCLYLAGFFFLSIRQSERFTTVTLR